MWPYSPSKTFLARLPHDSDLIKAIKDVFRDAGIPMGVFWAIGALKSGALAIYDQEQKGYRDPLVYPRPSEIVSCMGNISRIDGDLSVHAHIALSFDDGTMVGGHLIEGCTVFAGELFGMALEGVTLSRRYDEPTGLKLWMA